MSEEKRMLGNYEVTQSIYVGDKEVVLAVDKKEQYPFLVCYCDYHNPLSAAWATEGVASDDYLEAMEIFTERVQSQIDRTRAELSKFPFDKAVFTKEHCIPDDLSAYLGRGRQRCNRRQRSGGVWYLPCHGRKSQMGKVRCAWGNQARMYARLGKRSPCQSQGAGKSPEAQGFRTIGGLTNGSKPESGQGLKQDFGSRFYR